jgi:glycerol dehydrogenase
VFGDPLVLSLTQDRLTAALRASGMEATLEPFGGECCWTEIHRLHARARQAGAQIVVGVGGGKAADAAKLVAMKARLPVAVVPTIASTDAPTSHIAAVYDESHVIQEVVRTQPAPSLVVVDTGIIAQAPVRFLVAGMGDALSTKFEAEACHASGASNVFGGKPTLAALQVARLAYDVIRWEGEAAKKAAQANTVNEALEAVVEANILLSGLGFESGGLAAAHALHAGFTLIEEMNQAMHGEKVAFGVLVQLVLEGREPAFLADLLAFYRRVGLPTDLATLGLREPNEAKLGRAAERACRQGSYMRHMPFPVNPQTVVEAVLRADALGRTPSA